LIVLRVAIIPLVGFVGHHWRLAILAKQNLRPTTF